MRGQIIQKIITAKLLLVFLFFSSVCLASDTIDEFTSKVIKTEEKLKIQEASYNKVRAKYEAAQKRIELLKAKQSEGIAGVINSFILKIKLSGANRLAHRAYVQNEKIKELKDDYLTYVLIIIEEYNTSINNCIKNRCDNLKEIYLKRKKWVDIVRDYETIMQMEVVFARPTADYKEDALKDFRDYLKKKLIQVEQRLFILGDEKKIRDEVYKEGIKLDIKERFRIDTKISELKKLQKKLKKKLEKVESRLKAGGEPIILIEN